MKKAEGQYDLLQHDKLTNRKVSCHTLRLHIVTLNYSKPESHINKPYKNQPPTLQKTPCLYYKEQKHINIYGNS